MRRLISFFLALIFAFILNGQSFHFNELGVDFQRSNILPQNLAVNQVNDGPFNAFNLSLYTKRSEFNYKDSILPNQIFGYRLGIVPNVSDNAGWVIQAERVAKFLLLGNERYQGFIQLGYGFGFIQKVYDRVNNPFNIASSQQVNLSAGLRFMFQAKLSGPWFANTEVGLFHLSNGGTQTPNAGLNAAFVSTGLIYRRNNYTKTTPFLENTNEPTHAIAVGGFVTRGKRVDFQWIGGAFVQYELKLNRLHKLLLSTDFTMDGARIQERRYWENDFRTSDLSYVSIGTGIGFEIHTKVFYIQSTFGIYLANSEVTQANAYNIFRLVRPTSVQNLSVYVGTRTRKFTAKFMEFGLKYAL